MPNVGIKIEPYSGSVDFVNRYMERITRRKLYSTPLRLNENYTTLNESGPHCEFQISLETSQPFITTLNDINNISFELFADDISRILVVQTVSLLERLIPELKAALSSVATPSVEAHHVEFESIPSADMQSFQIARIDAGIGFLDGEYAWDGDTDDAAFTSAKILDPTNWSQ